MCASRHLTGRTDRENACLKSMVLQGWPPHLQQKKLESTTVYLQVEFKPHIGHNGYFLQNANSQAPGQIFQVRNSSRGAQQVCVLVSPGSHSDAHQGLAGWKVHPGVRAPTWAQYLPASYLQNLATLIVPAVAAPGPGKLNHKKKESPEWLEVHSWRSQGGIHSASGE